VAEGGRNRSPLALAKNKKRAGERVWQATYAWRECKACESGKDFNSRGTRTKKPHTDYKRLADEKILEIEGKKIEKRENQGSVCGIIGA